MCQATDPVEERKLRRKFIVAAHADERREARQKLSDEAREVQAQAAACLIEALEEMRPFVGTV
jgi:hypothetical protein